MMIVKQDGKSIEIPLAVEAQGGAAIQKYVNEQVSKNAPKKAPKGED